MAFCEKCNTELKDGEVCDCTHAPNENKSKIAEVSELIADLPSRGDFTSELDRDDITQNKVISGFAYLGILIAIPMFFAKGSKFARFHTNQGLVLLIGEVLYALIYGFIRSLLLAMSWRMGFVINALGIFCIFFLALLILGIINALHGKAKELPLIGRFKILK